MPLSPPWSIHYENDMLNDCKSVLRKLDNMKNVFTRSNCFMDSKLMMLKLRRARLGAQLAYSRYQSVLTESELRLAESDLKNELTRRRQFVNRSRAIRQNMKSIDVTSKKNKATEIDEDAIIDERNTVDKSTQMGEVTDKTDKVERSISSKKKQRTDKDSARKENTKTSRIGTDETNSIDKATTSSKEIRNSKPSKKQKTDVKSHCSDKDEKTSKHNRDSREKRKERRDGKKSSKDKSCKPESDKKSASSNNEQELHNDKHKGKDSETNEKHGKKRHETQVKKPTKSVLKNSTTKDICESVSSVSKDQTSNGNKNEEFSEPNLSSDMKKTRLNVEEINYICEASEENRGKDIENTTADEVVQASNCNKCDIFLNGCNNDKSDAASRTDVTVVLKVRDRNVEHQIQEMCDAPDKEVLGSGFEELAVIKRERSTSISSVETLKL